MLCYARGNDLTLKDLGKRTDFEYALRTDEDKHAPTKYKEAKLVPEDIRWLKLMFVGHES